MPAEGQLGMKRSLPNMVGADVETRDLLPLMGFGWQIDLARPLRCRTLAWFRAALDDTQERELDGSDVSALEVLYERLRAVRQSEAWVMGRDSKNLMSWHLVLALAGEVGLLEANTPNSELGASDRPPVSFDDVGSRNDRAVMVMRAAALRRFTATAESVDTRSLAEARTLAQLAQYALILAGPPVGGCSADFVLRSYRDAALRRLACARRSEELPTV